MHNAQPLLVAALLIVALAGCKSNPETDRDKGSAAGETQATPTGTETTKNTAEAPVKAPKTAGPIVGETAGAELLEAHPEWNEIAREWSADADAIATLAAADDVTVEVYLGTWCGDSRREVSRWLGAIEGIEGGPTVRYIAVDRSMDAGGEEIPDTLTNVPTFYVSRDGTPLGRVVETAVKNIEVDIADLVSGERSGFISASVEP